MANKISIADALRELMGAEGGEPGDSPDQRRAWKQAAIALNLWPRVEQKLALLDRVWAHIERKAATGKPNEYECLFCDTHHEARYAGDWEDWCPMPDLIKAMAGRGK
jgi:hypothetical protein